MKEQGEIRFEEDGTVTIITGTLDYGQGHWSPFAQVLHSHLGVPFDAIRLMQGDSDLLIAGGGTGGSKSLMASGAAIVEAAQLVIEKGKLASAHMLEAAVGDIEFTRDAEGLGRFTIAGTDRSHRHHGAGRAHPHRQQPAAGPAHRPRRPPRLRRGAAGLSRTAATSPRSRSSRRPAMPRWSATSSVNDFGVMVNPLLVAGQAHGGIVQGIGQALYERVSYSEEGQLLSGSYQDYCLPRAGDLPDFGFESHPVGLQDQSARRQGLRRGRLRRLAAGGDECAGRCAARASASATSTCRPRPKTIWRAISAARA